MYAVIVTEAVWPTESDGAPGDGVSVTSVFPAVAASVPTAGASKFHCGYRVIPAKSVIDWLFV